MQILDPSRHNPAIGLNYGQTPLGRLLIVGLSHYGPKDKVERPGFTQDVVGNITSGARMSYFTKIADLFERPVADFFSSVAFYNYLRDAFENPGEPVDEEYWKKETERGFFFDVLDEHKPDRVLITGQELWRRLVSRRKDGSAVPDSICIELEVPFECVEDQSCCIYHRTDGGKALLGAITHPSTPAFSERRGEMARFVGEFIKVPFGAL